jgi:N-acetylmuramoyl-L-alanine amidase
MLKKIIYLIITFILLSIVFSTSVFATQDEEAIILTDNLNIRLSADSSSESLGVIAKGESAKVLSYYDGWYYIEKDSLKGWVNCWFVYVNNEPVITGAVSADNVNLRSDSSLDSEVITILNRNTFINIYGRDDNWYYVSTGEYIGWVHNDFIEQYIVPIGSGVVLGDNVNVRNNPNLNGAVETQVDKGKQFNVYGEYEGWYKIMLDDGEYGWIHGDFIDVRYNSSTSRSKSGLLNVLEPPKTNNLTITQQSIIDYAKEFIGVKYVWGGQSSKGFDCSGFVLYVYDSFGIELPHRADLQARNGEDVSINELKPADVIFFDTNGGQDYINHVGIYIGDGQFIHASSSNSNGHAVAISNLEGFYLRSYMCARRYIDY